MLLLVRPALAQEWSFAVFGDTHFARTYWTPTYWPTFGNFVGTGTIDAEMIRVRFDDLAWAGLRDDTLARLVVAMLVETGTDCLVVAGLRDDRMET
jgi:hypothetical protein